MTQQSNHRIAENFIPINWEKLILHANVDAIFFRKHNVDFSENFLPNSATHQIEFPKTHPSNHTNR